MKDERERLSESTYVSSPGRCYLFLVYPVVRFDPVVLGKALVEGECVLADIAPGRECRVIRV